MLVQETLLGSRTQRRTRNAAITLFSIGGGFYRRRLGFQKKKKKTL